MQFSALMVRLPSWARRPEIIRSHDDLHINRRLLNIFQAEPHKAQGCTTSSRSISTSAVSDFYPPLSYPSLGSVFPERRETFRKLHKFGLQPGRLQASRLNTVDQKNGFHLLHEFSGADAHYGVGPAQSLRWSGEPYSTAPFRAGGGFPPFTRRSPKCCCERPARPLPARASKSIKEQLYQMVEAHAASGTDYPGGTSLRSAETLNASLNAFALSNDNMRNGSASKLLLYADGWSPVTYELVQ